MFVGILAHNGDRSSLGTVLTSTLNMFPSKHHGSRIMVTYKARWSLENSGNMVFTLRSRLLFIKGAGVLTMPSHSYCKITITCAGPCLVNTPGCCHTFHQIFQIQSVLQVGRSLALTLCCTDDRERLLRHNAHFRNNILRPRQYGHYFTADISKCIFLN